MLNYGTFNWNAIKCTYFLSLFKDIVFAAAKQKQGEKRIPCYQLYPFTDVVNVLFSF